MDKLKLGKYRHYKGKLSKHSETLEEFVFYKALYDSEEFGKSAIWVRPKKMFMENVIVDGKSIPRFKIDEEKNVEVETRSLISKEKYEELLEYFRMNASLVREDNQENYYYDSDANLVVQRGNSGSMVRIKKGKIHDNCREEKEIYFSREDFDKINGLLVELGYKNEIKWYRNRKEFDWEGVRVCLDYTKGYGYIIELEEMSDDANKDWVLKKLRSKLIILKVDETSKEEFNKKYEYYISNWRELVEDDRQENTINRKI